MTNYPKAIIRDKRVPAIRRRHPWIFSGAIKEIDPCEDGDLVTVETRRGEFLATGYYQDGSIMIRVLSFEDRAIDSDFWTEKVQHAVSLRANISLPSQITNVYRLFHGEGDGVPGLIIDIYNNVAVMQCHTIGVHMMRDDIADAIQANVEGIDTIYLKSGQTLPANYASNFEDYFLLGDQEEVTVLENGCAFIINVVNGQKTGFFIDQRLNRLLLQQFAKGKDVLNLFSYTGGFSIYALEAGARKVTSVDVSEKALAICDQNVALIKKSDIHESLAADVNHYLKEIPKGQHDIIIVDPPAFAKSIRKKHNAVQAYKRVNLAAIKKVKPGGLIFTFSCSQVIDQQLFYHTITAAAIEAQLDCQVLYHLSQGPDHPVSLFHPEGRYLKGLVLRVS